MQRPFGILVSILLLGMTASVSAYDIPGFTPDQIIPFKETVNSSGGAVTLNLHVFTPPGHQPSHQRPAIVFFFGGGWSSGSASHFHPQCEYLASRGMVAISAEYRVSSSHGTTPKECVMDGKSAIRYVREHADELGVNPDRIAGGGGSAGGHVAAATATLTAYEEPGENLTISAKPNALVLFNPVIDNGPGGWGYNTVQAYWETISPLHNINATVPPTAFFLGTNDSLIPVATAKSYQAAMEAVGQRCDLHLYQGQPHSFFNYDVPGDASGPFYGFRDTMMKADAFLVSLGYLSDPGHAIANGNGWLRIDGNADFTGDSEATPSPTTTDADADAIATSFDPVSLSDGEFVRLTGTVTVNAPLTSAGFRIGIFNGATPVTTGTATGYTGFWAGAPDTTASSISAGDGTGSHPFDDAAATTLGPIPAAAATLAADTSVDFSFLIARNGDQLDIAAQFTDGGSYRPSQSLINLTSARYTFDRVAFLLGDSLNATQANFTDVQIFRGPTPSDTPPASPPTANGLITYIDAVAGASGNTFATGGALADTSWLVTNNTGSVLNTQWDVRSGTGFGNGEDDALQALVGTTGSTPELTTQVTGLADGTYTIYTFFWDNEGTTEQRWNIDTGLTSGSLTSYASPSTSVMGTTTVGVTDANLLTFDSSVLTIVNSGLSSERRMFGVDLGEVTVSGGTGTISVFVDHSIGTSGLNRTWYDGVGYRTAGEVTPAPTYTRLLGVDFNRDDQLGSPSQAGFRVISGSAANQGANAPAYTKAIGSHQVTVSQPQGTNFEFRGANGDSSRPVPGGDTSQAFLVSDFIATREGAIDIQITGLPAGTYRFRSWHLDPFTGSALGFAQGATPTTPNLIEAQVGGLTLAAGEPTALGAAGLDTTFIDNAQIPTLAFPISHDGRSPLTIRLRAIDTNGSERFLLLNGFDLSEETP